MKRNVSACLVRWTNAEENSVAEEKREVGPIYPFRWSDDGNRVMVNWA